MPLLTEREHMQLWCPEARTVVFETREAPKVLTADTPNVQIAEASPTFNRLDFGPQGGLKIPTSCLCFGSRCGAWQWSPWHRGTDGKDYPTREELKAKDPNMNGEQLGYCGKAMAGPWAPVPVRKASTRPETPPPAANENGNDNVAPAQGAPKGETLQ